MQVADNTSGEDSRLLAEIGGLLAELHGGRAERVALDSDLVRDLGLDSLALIELTERLERAFGVALGEEVLARASTPADLLVALTGARGRPVVAPRAPTRLARRGAGEPWPRTAPTLTAALAWHAEAHPDLVSIELLAGAVGASLPISYGTLARAAMGVARGLIAGGIARGDRVALMLPTGRDYFATFLGVLLSGGVPVPLYPPARPKLVEEHLGRQARLLASAGARVLVTVPEARLAARLVRGRVPTLEAIRTPGELEDATGPRIALPRIAPEDLALIQYTSGSTGDPKGVMLTHAELLANIAAMCEAAAVSPADVFVSWLPLYHDMGLIGAWLASLVVGFPLVVMSPLAFLARPVSWLDAISRHRGTLSAAPNFAYALCASRIGDGELAGLDLSSWRIAFNGSEPVGARDLDRFAERFQSVGLRPEALCPAYGLAEVGVGVTFTPPGRGPHAEVIARDPLERDGRAVPTEPGDPEGRTVVSCGSVLPGYSVRIADPSGTELGERREGEIECRGPSATKGYFGNEAASAALWRNGWMRTGDLGYLAGGELYLTGRTKDLVIRAGRNLHPEELEEALFALDGVVPGGVALFASLVSELGTERLVAAVETSEPTERRAALARRCEECALEILGEPLGTVLFVPPGALPRTASGKIRRGAARAAFEAGTLGEPAPPVALQLARLGWPGLAPLRARLTGALARAGYGAYAWALVLLVGAPLLLAVHLPLPRSARWAATRRAGMVLRALLGVGWQLNGRWPGPGEPALVVANHASFLDGLVLLLASPVPLTFVASTDIERSPVVGGFLERLGCAFVHRDEPDRTLAELTGLIGRVVAGERLAVFPEGGLAAAPGLRPFHLGAFAVASAASCPIVPVAIRGTRAMLRPGAFLPRPGAIRVDVGEPIPPGGSDFAAQLGLRDRVRAALGVLAGERALDA